MSSKNVNHVVYFEELSNDLCSEGVACSSANGEAEVLRSVSKGTRDGEKGREKVDVPW